MSTMTYRPPLPDLVIVTHIEEGDAFYGTWEEFEDCWGGMVDGGDPDEHVASFARSFGKDIVCTYELRIDAG